LTVHKYDRHSRQIGAQFRVYRYLVDCLGRVTRWGRDQRRTDGSQGNADSCEDAFHGSTVLAPFTFAVSSSWFSETLPPHHHVSTDRAAYG
jgi:hypothetical protein